MIGGDYLAAVEKNKPILHVWPINSQQTVQGMRFVLPGKASAFACSGDGAYCIAGIEEKIYLWSIASGSLLTIISRHYQKIRHLRFSMDGKFFVSAAEDGMVMVWSLRMVAVHPEAELVTQSRAGQHDPVYIFNDHTSSISGSDDETLILWHIPSREPIRTIKHKGPITNAFFTTDLNKIHEQDLSPNIILHNLQRTLDKDSEETPVLEILTKTQLKFWPQPTQNDIKMAYYNNLPEGHQMQITDSENKQIEEELIQLKNINSQLYRYAINIIKSNTNMTTEQVVHKKINK
ncbi:WD repeat-containing protein 18 [Eumeta japonica]|uniref:WD repeat-containing protein 18 n=1 Tax=Eumeta variegata TaxID=151549 RepID=A0A4C1YR49_EUMVA|nr:WD repeat-containing protein 18 [Eumeta japonica]